MVRQDFLTLGEIDPATIENEYRDAKKRYRAQVKAVKDWEKRAGLEDLCTSLEQARSELNAAEEALTTVVPESTADAAADPQGRSSKPHTVWRTARLGKGRVQQCDQVLERAA
ncbi:hypothetical protein [Bradyrhizobium sp.]|uniref:hypothetical protein n=1 Tax=Bradyrhizobium sp. TaxID=376 RepID=UPI003C5A558E